MLNNKLSEREFKQIKKMIQSHTGINLTDRKKALVVSRLSRRLRELQFSSFSRYIKYIKNNKKEMEKFCNNITTNVTYFFREENHFDYLKDNYLPEVINKKKDHKIRCWSAGCSTGEEPYSIAILLKEFFRGKNWKIQILASDINTEVLRQASKGIYTEESVLNIPYSLLKRYFRLGTGKNKGYFKIKKEIKNSVTFRKINLKTEKRYPVKEPLDFIFCRNVFIYFNKDTQINMLNKFYDTLNSQGRLFMGHSERIHPEDCKNKCWQLCAPTIYKKH